MGGRAYAARFVATCCKCAQPIEVGHMVCWSRHDGRKESPRRVWHNLCRFLPDAGSAMPAARSGYHPAFIMVCVGSTKGALS